MDDELLGPFNFRAQARSHEEMRAASTLAGGALCDVMVLDEDEAVPPGTDLGDGAVERVGIRDGPAN